VTVALPEVGVKVNLSGNSSSPRQVRAWRGTCGWGKDAGLAPCATFARWARRRA